MHSIHYLLSFYYLFSYLKNKVYQKLGYSPNLLIIQIPTLDRINGRFKDNIKQIAIIGNSLSISFISAFLNFEFINKSILIYIVLI